MHAYVYIPICECHTCPLVPAGAGGGAQCPDPAGNKLSWGQSLFKPRSSACGLSLHQDGQCTDCAWEEQGESFLREKSVTILQPKPAPKLRGLTAGGTDGTEHWEDISGFVVLWDGLRLMAHPGKSDPLISARKMYSLHALLITHQERKALLRMWQNSACYTPFSLSSLGAQQSCLSQSASSEGSSGLSTWCSHYQARISIFWPFIHGSHSFPSAHRPSSLARLESYFLKDSHAMDLAVRK